MTTPGIFSCEPSAKPHRTCGRIGVLEMASPDQVRLGLWDIFRERLRELGYLDGQQVLLEFRWADGQRERLVAAAEELVRSHVDVLVTAGTPAATAAILATREIPIVMATGVGVGTELVEGVHELRPNVTGISDLPAGISRRRLDLLRQALSPAARLGILGDRDNPSSMVAVDETQKAASSWMTEVRDYWVAGPQKLARAFEAMSSDGIAGFVFAPGAMFFAERKRLAELGIKHRLATMAVRREYAEAGCLLAYGAPIAENYRRAALYVSRILDGAGLKDLPVHQPTVFDFVVN